jgi:hypothetical protein
LLIAMWAHAREEATAIAKASRLVGLRAVQKASLWERRKDEHLARPKVSVWEVGRAVTSGCTNRIR